MFFSVYSYAEVEDRIIGAAQDDTHGTWFTFEYSETEVFTLSFAGSGPGAGVIIVPGKFIMDDILRGGPFLCYYDKNDPEHKLQTLIKDKFMVNYGIGGSIDINPENSASFDSKITNPILYYFIRAAQDAEDTIGFLCNIDCYHSTFSSLKIDKNFCQLHNKLNKKKK
tara:strand:+ start:361 stop:864 length:504 start_codon:yes stop_codon:yes gene_type:complete